MKIDTITRINNYIESLIKSRNINQLEAYIANINFSISLNLFNTKWKPSDNDKKNWLAVLLATISVKRQLYQRPTLYKFMTRFCSEKELEFLE